MCVLIAIMVIGRRFRSEWPDKRWLQQFIRLDCLSAPNQRFAVSSRVKPLWRCKAPLTKTEISDSLPESNLIFFRSQVLQICLTRTLDVVLHIHVVMSVGVGVIADISGIMGKNGVDRFRLPVGGLYACFIGEKSAHGLTPPFPPAVGASQGKCAVRLCCVSVRTACQFPYGLDVQRSTGR